MKGLPGWSAVLLACGLWVHGAGTPAAPAGPPAVVVFQGQELFAVKTRVGSFPPEARARAIAERMDRLVQNPFEPVPPLQASPQEDAIDILCGETVLMTLTGADALAEGQPLDSLASQRIAQLDQALRSRAWGPRLKAAGLACLWILLVALGGLGGILALRALHRRIRRRILDKAPERLHGLRLQALELVTAQTLQSLALKGAATLHGLLLAALLYAYLSFVFSFFAATRHLATYLLDLVLGPLGQVVRTIINYLPNLVFLLAIALATRWLLQLVRMLVRGVQSGTVTIPHFYADWAEPTYKLVRTLVWAFALVVAFPYLPGSGSEAFKGVSLFVGLMFSLGSTGTVGNIVAGVMITYMRPFQVGDRIAIGDTAGEVVAKSLLVTRLRTVKNVDVSIPNAMIMSSHVQNFSANARDRGLVLHTSVTIGYDAPWRTVHALLIAAAAGTEGVLAEPRPFVLQTSLDDFFVTYQINAYTDQPTRMEAIRAQMHINIQDRFNEAGVEIMSPHYRSIRDGNPSTIPTPPAGAAAAAPGPD